MAEESVNNFLIAKQKAAERLGVPASARRLPDNREVEAALANYQRLFQGQAHASRLRRQREAALRAMEQLDIFHPRLAGPVLSGTATPHTPVSLHVNCDTAETMALWLHERGIPFKLGVRRLRVGDAEYVDLPCYSFDIDEVSLEILVFVGKQERLQPRSPVNGKPMQRVAAGELRVLLEHDVTCDPLLDQRDTAA
jgi:hypothetical protein